MIWKRDGQEGICKVVLHGKQAGARGIDCDTRFVWRRFFFLCVEVYLIRQVFEEAMKMVSRCFGWDYGI